MRKNYRNTNEWRLKYATKNQYITEEIKQEIKKLLQTNENESTIIWNLWNAAKSLFKGKFTAIKPHLKKQGKYQINNLTLPQKQLEKEQIKSKISRRKENIKIRTETNQTETKETIAKINETKSWFFENINKSDKPLAWLIKKKRERNSNH